MKYSMFIGRWQPWHKGHRWLIDNRLKKGKNVLICIRDMPTDQNNPFTPIEVKNKIEDELGDLFFTIISLSRHLKLNPDNVLQKSIKKFENRFLYLEKKIYDNKLNNDKETLERLWNEAKSK